VVYSYALTGPTALIAQEGLFSQTLTTQTEFALRLAVLNHAAAAAAAVAAGVYLYSKIL
jgi:hypothetical protein